MLRDDVDRRRKALSMHHSYDYIKLVYALMRESISSRERSVHILRSANGSVGKSNRLLPLIKAIWGERLYIIDDAHKNESDRTCQWDYNTELVIYDLQRCKNIGKDVWASIEGTAKAR